MGDVSSVFKFVSGSVSYDTEDVFLVKLDPNINNTDDLFNSLYYMLWFPGYFGFNWNALEDCLRDFEWIDENHMVIVHKNLPGIPFDDLKIYLEILRDIVIFWRGRTEKYFDVIFNERDRVAIENIL